jgi:hypothetical protein
VELNLEATSNPSFPNISDVQQKDEIIYFQTQYRDNFFGGYYSLTGKRTIQSRLTSYVMLKRIAKWGREDIFWLCKEQHKKVGKRHCKNHTDKSFAHL